MFCLKTLGETASTVDPKKKQSYKGVYCRNQDCGRLRTKIGSLKLLPDMSLKGHLNEKNE